MSIGAHLIRIDERCYRLMEQSVILSLAGLTGPAQEIHDAAIAILDESAEAMKVYGRELGEQITRNDKLLGDAVIGVLERPTEDSDATNH